MPFRLFSIPATGSPDLEEELNRFLRSHRVVTTQKTLQAVDGVLRWCFCVEYLDGAPVSGVRPSGRTERIDYKQVLPPDDFILFAKLRDLRKELAALDAAPVYTIATNEQLAEMATKRPATMPALKEIDGFGDAKAPKYGLRFLAALAESTEAKPDEAGG